MTIELANRLVEFRKKFGYSQEELGNLLNVSRQSISNWESGEVTPSIDYLKELAKLYNVTLDELVNTDKSVDEVLKNKNSKDAITMNNDGVHLVDDDGSRIDVNVDMRNSSVSFKENGKDVFVDSSSERRDKIAQRARVYINSFFPLLAVLIYLLLGFLLPNNLGWRVYWVIFILIPVPGALLEAIIKRRFCLVPIPLLVTATFLFLGVRFNMWHPWWLLFLAIPLYYSVFGPVDKLIHDHAIEKAKQEKVVIIDGDKVKVKDK